MSLEYLKLYDEQVAVYEKIFHIRSNESIDEILNLISTVLVDKYKISYSKIITSISTASKYNWRSRIIYLNILNQICKKNSITMNDFKRFGAAAIPPFAVITEDNEVCVFDQHVGFYFVFSEDNLEFIILNDQIDKFKDYANNHSLKSCTKATFNIYHGKCSLIEFSAYSGSVNIFYFLHSSCNFAITEKCLQLSLIGGNTDIINECLKLHPIDDICIMNAISSHNNSFLEYVNYDVNFINFDCQKFTDAQNLKALFIFFEKDKNSIIPWCAAFPQSIDLLKNENLDFGRVDRRKRNLLHFAALYDNIEICKLLLGSPEVYKININAKDSGSKTPIEYAAEKNYKVLTEFLISHGAEINEYQIPLRNNCTDTAEIFLSHGVDVNAKIYATPILIAAIRNHSKDVAKLIVEHGANVNERDIGDGTALQFAVCNNYKDLAESIILKGADLFAEDRKGRSAIYYARTQEMKDLLVKYGGEKMRAKLHEVEEKQKFSIDIGSEFDDEFDNLIYTEFDEMLI